MKYFKLVLAVLIFGFTPFLLSAQDLIADAGNDTVICKHFPKGQNPNSVKSVINPNPLELKYDVSYYKLDIEAYDTSNLFTGYAMVGAKVVANTLDTFSIELSHKLVIDSVLFNNILHPYTHINDLVQIPLISSLVKDDNFLFTLYYHTPPDYTSIYYGSFMALNYGNFPVAYSFSEPYFAHEWMPCKQELEDKADSLDIFITTNSDRKVAGPGTLTTIVLPDGKSRFEWRLRVKTAYYLIFFAISDYQEYNIYAKPDSLPGDSILIQNYVYNYPNCLESNKNTIDLTPGMIEWLSNQYGLFPFYHEKYGHYMWYSTSFSGMEHITMTGMRSFGYDLISHELAHSWFGDNVTCATWQDIWVNEGFATYTQYLVRQALISQANADAQMIAYQDYAMSSPGGSVFVPESGITSFGRIFSTRLTYRKGGALLHMIRFEMQNDSLFFKTLYKYQERFKDSVATGLDFKAVCDEVSEVDFTDFFNQWYFGEGYPIYKLNWWQNQDTIFLNPIQTTSTSITPLFKMLMEYRINYLGGDTIIKRWQKTNDTLYAIYLPQKVTSIDIDPNNWVLNKVEAIVHRKLLDIHVELEGPYSINNQQMNTNLIPDYLPQNQPYNQTPWLFSGTENLTITNNNIVDWMLIRLYDTLDLAQIIPSNKIFEQALILQSDGQLLRTDGQPPYFEETVSNSLWIELIHRNHLDIISANALTYNYGIYSYDFSENGQQAYGGTTAQKEIFPGTWGMIAGDANADGLVDDNDKLNAWESQSGLSGYLQGDLNLDGQTNNLDKDDYWLPNLGASVQIPF